VDELKHKYRGQINVVYVSVDRSKGKELAREYGVIGTPTILFLDREGNQVNGMRGALSQATIEQAIKKLLARR